MAKINMGQKIVCDGHYLNSESGDRVRCDRELQPGTNAIVNKEGVMGHFCECCHDPARMRTIAAGLGSSQEEFYQRWQKLDPAQKFLGSKLAKKNGNGKGKPAAAAESGPPATGDQTPADVASTQNAWPPAEDQE